jgi:hypothetical protein
MPGERRGAHIVRAAGAALVLVLGLGACEGDNLFRGTPPVTDGPPQVTQLLVPATARTAEEIPVLVRANARRGLDEVIVRYRGALDTDQNFGFQFGTDSATVNTSVEIFTRVDSLLIVQAVAYDLAGRSSAPVTDTVFILPDLQSGRVRSRD